MYRRHRSEFNSHSTMYLLKLLCPLQKLLPELYSHSTMYLLKLAPSAVMKTPVSSFTFHHVSIKTIILVTATLITAIFTFHHVSIKTLPFPSGFFNELTFTFHHVSIKTHYHHTGPDLNPYSHSTMYLLKRFGILTLRFLPRHSHSTMYLLKL